MIIWSGLGFLVPAVTLIALVLMESQVEAWKDDPTYYQDHGWPKLVGLLISASIVYGVARFLDARPTRTVIDKETGQEFQLGGGHTFFWLKIEIWSYILAVLGVVFLFL